MRIFAHLASSALGHLFGALGLAIVFAAIGGGAVLGYAHYIQHTAWPPSTLTEGLAVVIGVLSGYAAATTVLLRGIAETVLGAANAVEKEAEKVIKA